MYRSILNDADIGTARCYASLADDPADHYWLCLENVPGVELYQVGELLTWQSVAEWLARLHERFSRDGGWRSSAGGRRALRIGEPLMQAWYDRAHAFAAERQDVAAREALRTLESCWKEVVATLVAWPRTLLHGEFYASNVLVGNGRPLRVCPIDWEMAADGPGVIDLAALTAGVWPHDEPGRIVDAYVDAAVAQGDVRWTRSDFDHALVCARVYLAVQWLGWARDWTPPSEHSHDWAAELATVAQSLCS